MEKHNNSFTGELKLKEKVKPYGSFEGSLTIPDDGKAVNHPNHYNQYPVETIDMMIAIWGTEKVADFCLMSAFKYRMRMGYKDNIEQELAKEKWYLSKANNLININNIEK